MSRTTVRVRPETHVMLQHLASEMNESMQDVLAKAVEAYRRQRILQLTNEAYAALRADPEQWSEVLRERRAWDAALLDGLQDD